MRTTPNPLVSALCGALVKNGYVPLGQQAPSIAGRHYRRHFTRPDEFFDVGIATHGRSGVWLSLDMRSPSTAPEETEYDYLHIEKEYEPRRGITVDAAVRSLLDSIERHRCGGDRALPRP